MDHNTRNCYLCLTVMKRVVLLHPETPTLAWAEDRWVFTFPGLGVSPEKEVSSFATPQEAREYACGAGLTVLGAVSIQVKCRQVSKWRFYYERLTDPVLNTLARYDLWCEDRVRALLLWIEEWLSITQRQAERAALAIYFVGMAWPVTFSPWPNSIMVVVTGFATFSLWRIHRRPLAARRALFHDRSMRILRLMVGQTPAVTWMIGLSARFAIKGQRPPFYECMLVLGLAALAFLMYSFYIGSNGERGRRRKLAWSELKKLFGAAVWLPKPVAEN